VHVVLVRTVTTYVREVRSMDDTPEYSAHVYHWYTSTTTHCLVLCQNREHRSCHGGRQPTYVQQHSVSLRRHGEAATSSTCFPCMIYHGTIQYHINTAMFSPPPAAEATRHSRSVHTHTKDQVAGQRVAPPPSAYAAVRWKCPPAMHSCGCGSYARGTIRTRTYQSTMALSGSCCRWLFPAAAAACQLQWLG
jgi:hypothetical protein